MAFLIEFSDTMKGNDSSHGDYEKMYRNLYARYDGTNVTMDGYLDPTERTNLIVSGNLIKEFNMGDTRLPYWWGWSTLKLKMRICVTTHTGQQPATIKKLSALHVQWTLRSIRLSCDALISQLI